MARGGARNRSGPQADEASGRSEARGYVLTALPSEGFDSDVPDLLRFLPAASDRHSDVWAELWTTPQACAWSLESWRWPVAADLVKWMVRSEDPDATASIATNIRQLRDDLGLSAAGLKQNGWKIAVDEVAAKAAELEDDVDDPRDRLTVVPDVGSA